MHWRSLRSRIKCRKPGFVPENITATDVPILTNDLYEPPKIFAGEEFAKDDNYTDKNSFLTGISITGIFLFILDKRDHFLTRWDREGTFRLHSGFSSCLCVRLRAIR